MKAIILLLALISLSKAQWDPHFTPGRNVIVHLFEWRWNDIAEECERFLGPYGYGGVQISPPSENVLQTNPFRPWSERYTPVNYKLLVTRSGTEQEFTSMVRRCSDAGVRIYADTVINHLGGGAGTGKGTGGSDYNFENLDFPYFSARDFNDNRCPTQSGNIEDYGDPVQFRNCRLVGLPDLNQESDYVREQIVDYLNSLIDRGVAGFRVDAAKHMWPESLEIIFGRLHNLSREHGFPEGARPFVYQEVIDTGSSDPSEIIGRQYYHLGRITEFKYGIFLGEMLRGNDELYKLVNWGEGWLMHDENRALVFIDNHDNQRGHGSGGASVLTFRMPRLYKMAVAFMLAHPYGVQRVMSSYYWEQHWEDGKDQNDWIGPPHAANGSTLPVTINPDLTCGNGWICEHRWRQIFNMVKFRNVVNGQDIRSWWDNGRNQIAFCRGDKGFIAINNDDHTLSENLQTCLPPGRYCDVISGSKWNNACSGQVVTVGSNGVASISIPTNAEDLVIAIHADSRLD